MTGGARDAFVDTTWHEAGHVVGFWLRGFPCKRVLIQDRVLGIPNGVTFLSDTVVLDNEIENLIVGLMGDIVDFRRGVVWWDGDAYHPMSEIDYRSHWPDVVREEGRTAANDLRAAAVRWVDTNWEPVTMVAEALLASAADGRIDMGDAQLAALRSAVSLVEGG